MIGRLLCLLRIHALGKPRYRMLAGDLIRYRRCRRKRCDFWVAESAVRRG